VAAVEWTWKRAEFLPWLKADDNAVSNRYAFDVTKADSIFDLLLEKGHIKLIAGQDTFGRRA